MAALVQTIVNPLAADTATWGQWSPVSNADTRVLMITQTRNCMVTVNGDTDNPAPTCDGSTSATQTIVNPLAADTATYSAWSQWTPLNNTDTSVISIIQSRSRSCSVVVIGEADVPPLTCSTSETRTITNPLALPRAIAPANAISLAEDSTTTITLSGVDANANAAVATLIYQIATPATNGTVTIDGNIVTYTANANYNGADSFAFTVTAGNNLTSEPALVDINITAVNDAPVASDLLFGFNQNSATITLTASDIDGDTLSYSVVANPHIGTLSGTAPNLSYFQDGNDATSFAFVVTDNGGLTATATVTLVNATLTVAGSSATSITLAWSSGNYFKLYRSNGDTATLIYQGTNQQYTDTNLTTTTSYSYQIVYCIDANACSSLMATLDTATAPNAATLAAITALSRSQIALSWNAVAGASIYRIYRSTQINGVYTALEPVTSTSITDTGLTASTEYHYQISACTLDNADSSTSCSDRNNASAQGSASTTTKPETDASYNLTFNNSNFQVALSWTTTGANFVRISASTATATGFTEIYSGTATSYIHTNLATASGYYYRLQLCGDSSIASCFSLGSVSSQQTFTTPNIFSQYKSTSDFNTLTTGNNNPAGIWSNATTMWVADPVSDKIYAYTLATKTYDSSKDNNALKSQSNFNSAGIWSNGTTLWVANPNTNAASILFAYGLATASADGSNHFTTLSTAGNGHPTGIWSNGTTLWVADINDDKIYAYNLATKARDGSKDFNSLSAAGNTNPTGIWSDGTTLWVADNGDDKVYAYNLATKLRDSSKDFNNLVAAGNTDPYGIWSDGTTMWVADSVDGKIYAYNNLNFIETVTPQSSTQIALSWNAVAAASIYRIYRSTEVDGVYTQLSPVASTGTTDGGLAAATKYYYQIAACTLDNSADSTSCSDRTNVGAQGSASTQPGTDASYSLTSNNSTTQIQLSWSITGANFVRISASTATATGFTEIYSGAATSYIHTNLAVATSYYYRLQLCSDNSIASCRNLDSDNGQQIATTPNAATLSAVTPQSSTQIALSWNAVAAASIYRVYRSTQINGVYTQLSPVASTGITDGGLAAATKYYYQIVACTLANSADSAGTSCSDRNAISAQGSATTALSSDASYSLTFNSSDTQINLSWTIAAANFVRISASTATATGFSEIYAGTATSFVHNNLAAATSYYYRLQLCSDNDLSSCFALDTVSSQQAVTALNIYAFSNFGQYASASDFNTLSDAGNIDVQGIASDGTTLWVADSDDNKIYAYNLATKARDSSKDFNALGSEVAGVQAIWTDGTTMWLTNISGINSIFAYNVATKSRDNDKNINNLAEANHAGLWSDGTTMWAADFNADKIYAYNLVTKARDSNKDFEGLGEAGNNNPRGIWSDGTTMWVSDVDDNKVYAYNMVTKAYDSSKDFTLAAGNNFSHGIWSDGTTIWSSDFFNKIYAYDFSFITAVTAQSSTQIALSWDAVAGASIYRIYRSTEVDGVYTQLTPVASTSTTDGGLAAGSQYYYQIVACILDNANDSTGSSCSDRNNLASQASVTTMPSSTATYNLAFNNNSENKIELSWTTTGANFVRISASTATATGFTEIYSGTATSYIHTKLASATSYYYRLQLCGGNDISSCFSFDSVSSRQSYTAPNIYAFSNFAQRDSSNDFDSPTLIAAGNIAGTEIWSDGTTLWTTDFLKTQLYAYNLATKQRDSTQDFSFTVGGNFGHQGIWSNGTTMWIANKNDNKIFAYDVATKTYDSSNDFNTLFAAGNSSPEGIWSDGTTMWVVNSLDYKVYAYNLATKAYASTQDFNTLVAAGNTGPQGIWSDGTTMWVVDDSDDKVYAYNLVTKQRDSSKDINNIAPAGAGGVNGIWSNGTTLWLGDNSDAKIYAYDFSFITAVTAQSSTQIALSWDAVAGASIYRIYRSTEVDGVYTQLTPVASTSTTDGDLDAATNYYYQIAACTLDNTADSTASTCSDRNSIAAQASTMTMATSGKVLYSGGTLQPQSNYVANVVAPAAIATSNFNNSNPVIASEAKTTAKTLAASQAVCSVQINEHFLTKFSTSAALTWLPPTVNGDLLDQNHSYRWGSEVYGDWDQLLSYANNNNLCGFSDWRVPTADELQQLYTAAGSFSKLQSLIPNILAQAYWTSSTSSDSSTSGDSANTAITINLSNGVLANTAKASYQKLILISNIK